MARNGVALAAELFVARLALEVVAEESAQGWSVPGAIRPLFEHEVQAHTRFGDLDDASTAAARAIADVTDPLWSALLADLMDDLLDNSDSPTNTSRRIADLRGGAGVLRGYTAKIDDAASAIYRASLAARHAWARHTLTEAIAQNVNPAVLPDTNSLVPTLRERDYLQLRAEEVAQHPLRRMLDVADRVIASKNLLEVDPAAVLDELADELARTDHAGTNDLGRQLVHDAGNQGRSQVANAAPKPKYVYGSELLDTNTCAPCATVDGRRWETIEDADDEYPQGGGYRNCDGGRRCRGTLVYVWDEADPTLDRPNDGTTPPPLTSPAPLTDADVIKVIDGAERDGRLNGGHGFNAGVPGKTIFPDWPRAELEDVIRRTSAEPTHRTLFTTESGEQQIRHVLIHNQTIVYGQWNLRPDGSLEFFAIYPVNGEDVRKRTRTGALGGRRPFDISALRPLGFDL